MTKLTSKPDFQPFEKAFVSTGVCLTLHALSFLSSCKNSTLVTAMSDQDPNGSALVLAPWIPIHIEVKIWIRIRIGNQCGSTTLVRSGQF
jgi:hypothetical protein